MLMIYDRYLMRRFLHVFVILFLSMYGLYVVIDGFTNIDDFQEGQASSSAMLQNMGQFYLYQASQFFDLIGSIIAVTAVMVVFALLQKHCEIMPLLAAGVPMRRLFRPVVIGMLIVTGLIVANQEFVLPKIAARLEAPRGEKANGDKGVEPLYDHRTHILISGKSLFMRERRMSGPKFVLPAGDLAADVTTLRAVDAIWMPSTAEGESGWLLKSASPSFSELQLTETGTKIVRAAAEPGDAFIATEVSFEQLYNKHGSYKYLSTPQLIHSIRNPSDVISIRGQQMHLHTRMVRPLLNLACIFIAIPLMLRRESRSLIGSFALCSVVLGGMLGLLQLSTILGQSNLIAADLAAWIPIIACGGVATWVQGVMQT